MLKSIGVLLFSIGILLSSGGPAFSACPEGDLDNNCKVDFGDVMFLAERWLEGAGSQADIVGGDGVNLGDYAIVAAHWLEQGQTTGSVRVTISPPDVIVDGAQWMVDGGERHDSGETVSGLSVGSHTVGFIDVPGWSTPGDELVEIIAGQTESVSVTYIRTGGSLKVDIAPAEAVATGAQWRVDEGAWRNSGEIANDVYVGGHIIEFKDIDGWVSATERSVIVSEGQLTAISAQYSQPLVISEFLTNNNSPNPPDPDQGELVDEDGYHSDWIEIYNPTDIIIDLSGWYLTDNDSNLVKWQFPAGVELDGGDFLVVFASNKNRRDPAGPYLHTNFKLSSNPSYLALVSSDGITIVHEYWPEYPTQLADVSYGLAQSATEIVGEGDMVSYYVPTSSDAGKDWTAINFNDSSWDTGRTPLSFATEAVETGRDIGNPTPGSYSAVGGVYTVEGDGDDIWNQSDNFYYAYAPLSGDGELSARVTSIEYTHDWAKAGVMIRETLDAGSKHAMMVVTPTNLRSFQFRADTGGGSSDSSSPSGLFTLPYWVKMVRSGSTLTGYYAPDSGGVPGTWAVQNSTSISMASDVYIGLCVTSHSAGVLCTAVFDNVGGSTQAANDLMDAMVGINASLWVRAEFNLEAGQADTFDTFNLRMRYEDGFVAYLNGQLVATDNNPTALKWNSTALTDRPIEASQTFTSTNLMPYLDDLVVGKNVLAIQALNDNKNNEEFLISAELVSTSEVGVNQYFQRPTPWEYNVSGDMGTVGEVWFSHERGFYTSAFYLTLSTDTSGAEIRYTTDGSTPTDSQGSVYAAGSPIYINKTTPLRAMAWKPGHLASEVMTHTYFFVADVITQSGIPGPGWPASGAVNGQAMDYGMDPDILNDSRYKDLIDDALLAIPSISLVTDLANLFDPAIGIYVNPYGEGRNWERPSSAELINPDGSDGFHINAGLRIRGGYSRGTWNPKHAFRLFFRSEYGEANLEFPLFEDEGVSQFDKVDLRTSQNYSWAHGGSSQNTMVREVFSRDIQGATGQPYTRSRYYYLYINGVYWGLFQTQERAESVHAAAYMGGDRDDYDIVKTPGMYATDGTRESLDRLYDETMLGLDSLERYYRVQGKNMDGTRNPAYERLLDVDNVIDFMIIEYYTGDRDGPASRYTGVPNNTYGAYNRVNPDGWKWYHHDNEHTLGAGAAELNMVEPFTTAGAAKSAFNPHWLHQELANINVDYRVKFADHVYKAFYNDGLLTAENARASIQRRAEQIDMAIIAESARWGDASHHPAFTKQDWENEINWLLYNTSDKRVISDRVPTVIGQFRAVGWYPVLEPPTLSNPGGEVTAGQSLTMTAAGTIYYTTDGSDPRLSSAVSTSGSTVTLVSENAAKRVYIPTGPVTSTTGSILYEYYNGISGSS
ncbi:MAG: chitobiase/beta-hexosaminidase C-terminal domain-containing protein, partial [Sedimentisphaerales bacterium]|nr:chitobiase/beta-hexosaminidase C-terminal domain-containing protein [Sedimentisphaerales bacterium]